MQTPVKWMQKVAESLLLRKVILLVCRYVLLQTQRQQQAAAQQQQQPLALLVSLPDNVQIMREEDGTPWTKELKATNTQL